MSKPIRIQRSRQHKQTVAAIYVGRPSRWGNPFKVGDPSKPNEFATIEECLQAYELTTIVKIGQGWLNIEELRGQNLSCWCRVGDPCHVDVLLKLANAPQ